MFSIVQFNDAETTTHEMVMKVFDRAIAAESARLSQAGRPDAPAAGTLPNDHSPKAIGLDSVES